MKITLHTSYGFDPANPTYKGDRNFLLKVAENNPLRIPPTTAAELQVHWDKKTSLAIGYGYDLLQNKATAVEDLKSIGVSLTSAQIAAINSLSGTYTSVPAALAAVALPNEPAATALLNLVADRPLPSGGREAQLGAFVDANGIVLDNSTERAVLLSMWYQSPGGGGIKGGYFRNADNSLTNMSQSLVAGERAEVWYEIRYGSSKNGADGDGVVKRRFAESQVFGLYNDANSVGADEAKHAYRMLQFHRSKIQSYEDQYGAKIADANADYGFGGTADAVLSLINSLLPAQAALFADLASRYSSLSTLDPNNYISTNVYLDPDRDVRDPVGTLRTAHNSTLSAIQYNSSNIEVGFRDVLIGEDGNDTLTGGKGDDILIGGNGFDTYVIRAADGNDRIIDDDGRGALIDAAGNPIAGIFIKQGNQYISVADPTISATFNSPLTISLPGGSSVIVDGFVSDELGIRLVQQMAQPAPPGNTKTGTPGANYLLAAAGGSLLDGQGAGDYLAGGAGNDRLLGGNGVDYLSGSLGANWSEGGAGGDVIILGAGAGYANGGDGDDLIAYFGADILPPGMTGIEGQAALGLPFRWDGIVVSLDAGGNYELLDFRAGFQPLADGRLPGLSSFVTKTSFAQGLAQEIHGGLGVDVVRGGPGNDLVFGDAGADVLLGGAGNDSIVGGDDNDQLAGNSGADYLDGGAGIDQMRGEAGADHLFGGAGNDIVYGDSPYIDHALDGDDFLSGGVGDDSLSGDGGADVLLGGDGADGLFGDGDNGVVPPAYQGADYIDGGPGNDYAVAGGGDDQLFGGAGNDVLDGGAGNDYLEGGPDGDQLLGRDGNDRLAGDAGADWLYGGIGNDDLTGGDENDSLYGDAGDDVLDGGAGLDAVYGGDGNDTLVSSLGDGMFGQEILDGGAGSDTFIFRRGSYVSLEQDDPGIGSGKIDKLVLEDILPSDVFVYANYSFGPDFAVSVNLLDDSGYVMLGKYFNEHSQPVAQANRIEQIVFTDGTTWDIPALAREAYKGTQYQDRIQGFDTDDVIYGQGALDLIFGNGGNDVIDGGSGFDSLMGGTGNDTLLGSADDDWLYGEEGDDILDGGEGRDTLTGGPGNDLYRSVNGDTLYEVTGGGIDSGGIDTVEAFNTYTLGDNFENLTLTGAGLGTGTGNALNNVLVGNAGDNTLLGLGGNDTLNGGVGADSMAGGTGDDTYVVDNTGDVITENVNEGTDLVRSTVTYALAANVENLTLTGAASINATGNTLSNVLTGNTANNMLNGSSGADSMAGGAGNDTYYVDNTGDVVTEGSGAGTDLVQSAVTYALAVNVENLTLTGTAAINGIGNTLNNVLIGNVANNTFTGGAGNDTYVVQNTGDVVIEASGAGTDLVQSAIAYTLGANLENLTLTGPAAINGAGNTLNNVLTGNVANNTLTGGAGNDTYVVQNTGDVVSELAAQGTDLVQSTVTFALAANVENLTLTGTAAINGTGNTLNNVLTGNAANNTLTGGAGNDTYVVQNTGDVVIEASGAGTDLVQSTVTYTLAANVENLTLAGSSAINATGNTLNNVLTGNAANNVLNGSSGADAMAGGAGNDTYYVDSTGDVVTEGSGAGTDLVQSSIAYTLGANLENLTLTGAAAINATGNTLNNVLTGNAANNTFAGGAGNDTYVVQNTGDVVIEASGAGTDVVQSAIAYTLGANLENLTLTGTAAINGTGNSLSNVLTGNTANNTLTGGAGNDTYVVQNTADVVSELAGQGTDLVQSTVTYALAGNVENLTLTGSAAINATGNTLNNVLTGNAANNVLTGGAGNDTYVVQNSGDVVSELAGQGTDLVQSAVTYVLATNVENLTLTGSAAINATGNALNNVLTGNAANNVLNGGGSADSMAGGAGNDTYYVDNTGDVVTEGSGAGTDLVQSAIGYMLGANLENLTLTGSAAINATGNTLNNVLTGNAANNVLTGGAGNDTLNGGAGSDRFDYNSTGEGTDTIIGFAVGTAGDALDVRDVLVGYTPGTSALSNFLRLTPSGTNTILAVNADGTGTDFVNLAVLQNVLGLALDSMLAQGNLLVA